MKTNKYLLLGLLAVLPFLQMGCTHIDLEKYPEKGLVNITFNWRAPLSMGDSIPTAMKLYFYGKDAVITRDSKDSVYSGTLPNGNYQVIAYNTDATNVGYALATYVDAEVLVQGQNGGTKAISYLAQPSHSYGIGLGSFTVFEDSVVNETMAPLPFVKKIHMKYIVTGEKQAIASCSASLSGLALSVNIATGEASDNTGTVSFIPSSTSGGYESTVTFLGISNSVTNDLGTVLHFTGGGTQVIDVDIASALVGVINADIPIDVNLFIAVTGNVEAGFGATLTGWTVDTENVIVE